MDKPEEFEKSPGPEGNTGEKASAAGARPLNRAGMPQGGARRQPAPPFEYSYRGNTYNKNKKQDNVKHISTKSGITSKKRAQGNTQSRQVSGTRKKLVKLLKSKRTREVFNYISVFLSIFMAVLCIYIFYSAMTDRTQNGTSIGPFMMFNVASDSMLPTISTGTLVVTRHIAEKDLAIGDIITYQPSKEAKVLVTHRIVKLGTMPHFFVTRGDANNSEDEPVYYENIVGKVLFGIPVLGTIVTQARSSPAVMAMVIAVFVLFVVFIEIIKRLIKA